jgi:adenylylsulfate kinase-like enzyme
MPGVTYRNLYLNLKYLSNFNFNFIIMIYWFTGQPCAGKTVLANMLKEHLDLTRKMPPLTLTFRIDGDDMRELFSNKDYSIKGRVENVSTAQRIAHYLHNQGHDVIVSLVAPYLDQREEFKLLLGESIKEIYVHTSQPRERDHYKVQGYVAPSKNFIDIDTTEDSPEQSFRKLIGEL